MELDYALLAENADRMTTGKLCLFGADIDNVAVPNTPVVFQLSLVCKWLIALDEPLAHTVALDLERPSGERIRIFDGNIESERNRLRHDLPAGVGLIVTVPLVVSGAGLHFLHIFGDDEQKKSIPLLVREQSPAA